MSIPKPLNRSTPTMASFCIAGNVSSSSFTHAERLCDILKQTLKVCHVEKYVCLAKNWEAAQIKLCQDYNFNPEEISKLQCVVWHEDGRYIGGADAFSKYCKSTYAQVSDLELDALPGISQENCKIVTQMFEEASKDAVLLRAGATY